MIIYENKGYEVRSDCPGEDWTGQAKYVVPDGGELAEQILSLYPYYDFVEQDGVLTGVVAVAPPALTAEELRQQYESLTVQFIREQYDQNEESKVLREVIAGLTGAQESFNTYNTYVLECKDRARYEVYGDAVTE